MSPDDIDADFYVETSILADQLFTLFATTHDIEIEVDDHVYDCTIAIIQQMDLEWDVELLQSLCLFSVPRDCRCLHILVGYLKKMLRPK